jgi:S-methylmethionine-dependent homocysteine/selenocysteine methylase
VPITLLDGGISRELQRVGAPFRQPEWSALALIETPELVQRVHNDFAAAGAQVISTNSYAVVPFHIGEARFENEGATLAARSGQLAQNVARQHGIKVAGSLPPVLGSYRPDLFEKDAARKILSVLIKGLSPFADIWLAETQSSLAEALLIADLLSEDARPLWLSFTLKDEGIPQIRSGESVTEAAILAYEVGAAALLFNCSCPEVMQAAIIDAKATFAACDRADIAIGVYANGFATHADTNDANADIQEVRDDLSPAAYLKWAKTWAKSGATMIGGCCGISADHIAALSLGLDNKMD